MAKAGAKRRVGVSRYPKSGTIVRSDRGERPDKIMATVLAQPHRRGEKDPLAGFVCGRLWLGGMIDERQYDASEAFAKRAVRYMRSVTGTLPHSNNPLANLFKRDLEEQREQQRMPDFSIRSEPVSDEERIKTIREEYDAIQTALADAGMHFVGNTILMRVCIMDREPSGEAEMGAFRCALNVIANRLRIG